MARTQKLDYTYGEKPTHSTTSTTPDDGGTTAAAEAEIHARARARAVADEAKRKYLSYSDFATRTDYETNGYTYDGTDDFGRLDVAGWARMVGFVLVRMVSPLMLVAHAVVLGLVLWKYYAFDFSAGGVLAQQNVLPWAMGAICMHAAVVHGVAKQLFSHNYYKRRK